MVPLGYFVQVEPSVLVQAGSPVVDKNQVSVACGLAKKILKKFTGFIDGLLRVLDRVLRRTLSWALRVGAYF